jgi:hypothetical protein
MGDNSFAPKGGPNNNTFVVQNTDAQQRTLFIFLAPINYGGTRDLMKLPGIGPDDIKASLIKGELFRKISYGQITVLASNIDLLQFSNAQLIFLQNAGIATGLQISAAQMIVNEQVDIQLVGTVDGVNTTFMIPSGTWIQSPPLYKIIVYKNGVKQVLNDDYMIAESIPGNGYDTVIFAVPPSPTPAPPDIMTADYWINNS